MVVACLPTWVCSVICRLNERDELVGSMIVIGGGDGGGSRGMDDHGTW